MYPGSSKMVSSTWPNESVCFAAPVLALVNVMRLRQLPWLDTSPPIRIGIVYGGGKVGLMGAIADAALEAGGDIIGVIPQSLAEKELAHPRSP